MAASGRVERNTPSPPNLPAQAHAHRHLSAIENDSDFLAAKAAKRLIKAEQTT